MDEKGYEAVLVEGAEALADDLAGIDDGDEAVGVVLAQEVAQLQSLPTGEHGDQHAELVVGVGTVGLFHRGGAVHVVDDEVQNGLWVRGHNGAHLAQADVFNGTVHHKALADQAQDAVQAGAHAEAPGGGQHDEDVAGHQGLADLHRGIFGQDQGHNVGAAGGCTDVKHDGRTQRGQEHRKHQVQHGIAAHGHTRGVQPLAQRHEKGQGKGRIDGPAHALYAEEHKPQHHQHQVDDPHKAAHNTKELIDKNEFFSLSFLSEKYRDALNYCGSHSGRDENDKISAAGLTLTSRHSIPFIDEGNMILLCEKMSATRLTEDSFLMPEIAQKWYADHDMHTMYIAEIIDILAR